MDNDSRFAGAAERCLSPRPKSIGAQDAAYARSEVLQQAAGRASRNPLSMGACSFDPLV